MLGPAVADGAEDSWRLAEFSGGTSSAAAELLPVAKGGFRDSSPGYVTGELGT